jgi:hypothetical protein
MGKMEDLIITGATTGNEPHGRDSLMAVAEIQGL